MKKIKITNWIFTGLLAVLMLFSAIPDILNTPEAVEIITRHLGYPAYLVPFLGVAKLLGVIAIIVPGFPRLKEWAYAGFVIDVTGAVYSTISVGDPPAAWLPILIAYILIACSYIFYHKKIKASAVNNAMV